MLHTSTGLPPLDGLTALLAAADEGSFSGAAAKLGLTHGSVSRRISALEAWLGAALFERHGRGVRLTPAGQRFTAEVRRSLSGLAASAEQWRPWRGRQTVRLSVLPSVARLWLLPRLAQLEGSDIHIELTLDHRPTDLDAREADIAVRYGRGAWEGLDARPLFSETIFPVVSPALRTRLGERPSMETLIEHPLLHDSDISQWRAMLLACGLKYRPRRQDRRFEDYDTVLAVAEAGLGLALLRAPLASSRLAEGRLVRIHDAEMTNPAQHYACVRASETRQAVLALRDRLLTAAAS
jgi:DNA-binding transcriptional LysR family regulator